jgi:penicillin-binding protein 1A
LAADKPPLDRDRLRAAALGARMQRVVRERSRMMIVAALGAGLLAAVVTAASFWIWAIKDLPRVPNPELLWTMNRAPGVTFFDQSGRVVGVRGPYYGRALRHETLPSHVWQAFLAIEDQRFFEHRGVDRQGMLRAMIANLKAGRTVQGGSTITQQLVKNVFLTPERSIQRKLQEMILAGRIESRLTKGDILDLYLNRTYLGEQAFGVDAAARRYFGKSAHDLNVSEAAMLAGLPKAPSDFAPTRNFDKAKARQEVVLAAMEEAGYLSGPERVEAASAPIALAGRSPPEGELGYIFDLAVEEAKKRAGEDSPDMVIRLTVDLGLQDAAVGAVRKHLGPAWRSKTHPLQGALVSLDQSGAIRALVGGTSYQASKFNRATQAKRQPGSSFKTFVYAAALEAGLDPDTIRYDEPMRIGDWRPKNYDESFRGAVTLRTAFALSLNTVAAEIADEVGVERVADLACQLGIATSLPCNDAAREKTPIPPSIALGSMEVTLIEMTQAMSAFMRDGRRLDAFIVDRVENSRGELLYQRPDVAPLRVLDSEVVHAMNGLMGRVIQSGTGTRAKLPGRDVAGKTGTSQDWRDAWFVGFTADMTTGVWIGYDDFAPMPRVTGGGAPAAIFADFMQVASRDLPKTEIPGVDPPDVSPRRRAMSTFYTGLAEAFGKPRRAGSAPLQENDDDQ